MSASNAERRIATRFPEIMALLKASGINYECRSGKKHFHVLINGRLTSILPRGGNPDRSWNQNRNVIAQLRRAIRAAGGNI